MHVFPILLIHCLKYLCSAFTECGLRFWKQTGNALNHPLNHPQQALACPEYPLNLKRMTEVSTRDRAQSQLNHPDRNLLLPGSPPCVARTMSNRRAITPAAGRITHGALKYADLPLELGLLSMLRLERKYATKCLKHSNAPRPT